MGWGVLTGSCRLENLQCFETKDDGVAVRVGSRRTHSPGIPHLVADNGPALRKDRTMHVDGPPPISPH